MGIGSGIIDSVEFEGTENVYKAKSEGKDIVYSRTLRKLGAYGSRNICKALPSSEIARQINNPYINKFNGKSTAEIRQQRYL